MLAGAQTAASGLDFPLEDYHVHLNNMTIEQVVAPLDRRSQPRQVPDVEREQPVFGPSGEIFFRKVEPHSAFLYSVREDGSGPRRVFESPLLGLMSVHPSHKWLGLGVAPVGQVIFPVTGGAPFLTHLQPPPLLRWTGDGKYLFVVGAENQKWANTYVVPLSPGEFLPGSIARIFHRKRSWQSCRECGPYR